MRGAIQHHLGPLDSAHLYVYLVWESIISCINVKKEGKKKEREREREKKRH
jgi:hypothetical protein